MLIFISGNVRSGKSTFAEKIAKDLKPSGRRLHYLATSKAVDEEMKGRIARHVKQRQQDEGNWVTWEQPHHVGELQKEFCVNDVVLLDCLTILTANELFAKGYEVTEIESTFHRLLGDIQVIRSTGCSFIIVSNELFSEGVPTDDVTFHYSRLLGKLHQEVVAQADTAYLVRNGIPLLLKGKGGMNGEE